MQTDARIRRLADKYYAKKGTIGKSLKKRFFKLKKYRALGQYRAGVFYCKGGNPITPARLKQFEPLCHHMVRKFFPALIVNEASLIYEDLINQCRLEVFMAILNGYDPVKAMTSSIVDPVLREKQLEKKRLDPAAAKVQAEKIIVYGRLVNFLRRISHKYHPDQRGGRTSTYDSTVFGPISNATSLGSPENFSNKSLLLKEELLELLSENKVDELRSRFNLLSEQDKEELVDHLGSFALPSFSLQSDRGDYFEDV